MKEEINNMIRNLAELGEKAIPLLSKSFPYLAGFCLIAGGIDIEITMITTKILLVLTGISAIGVLKS